MMRHDADTYARLDALLSQPDPPKLVGVLYGSPRGYRVTVPGDPKRRWTVMLGLMTAWLQRRFIEKDPHPYIGPARRAK